MTEIVDEDKKIVNNTLYGDEIRISKQKLYILIHEFLSFYMYRKNDYCDKKEFCLRKNELCTEHALDVFLRTEDAKKLF